MNEMLLIAGVFDRLSGGNPSEKLTESEEYTLEDYKEILNEYKYAEAEILINIATINFEENHIRESLKNLEKAIVIYKELGDIEKQALVLDLIGDLNRYKKKNDIALDNYRKAYEFYKEVESDLKDEVIEKIRELEILQSAGEAKTIYNYGTPSEIPSETSVEKVTLSDYNKISKNIEEIIGMLNGADTYLSYAKSEDPMEALESAYEMSTGIGDDSGKATLLLIIGYVSLEKSKPYDALKYFNAAFENFQEIDDKMGEAVSRLLIGTTDYINGNMNKVSLNFRNAIEIFRELKDVLAENTAMKLINAIYEED